MLKLVLTLLMVSGIANGTRCDFDSCYAEFNEEFEPFDVLPTQEDLKRLCPLMLQSYECLHNMKQSCPGPPMEIEMFRNDEIISNAIEGIIRDLCNEQSTLHRNYTQSLPCANDYMRNLGDPCIREGRVKYEEYKEFQENLVDGSNIEDEDYTQCLPLSYAIGCVAADLQETCGEVARATFLEILRRSRYWEFNFCPHTDAIQERKSRFLNFLDLSEERQNIFSVAFDMRRKK